MAWSTLVPPGVLTTQSDTVTLGSQVRVGTAAQIAAYTGQPGELTLASDTLLLYVHDGSTAGGKVVHAAPKAYYREEQTSGTAGGTFTAGAWQKRTLNTEVYDDIGITVASSVLTLPAGSYEVRARASAFQVNRNRLRVYDTTNSALLALGHTSFARSTTGDSFERDAHVHGRFTLAAAANIELQHYGETTTADNGFGVESSAAGAQTEIYAELWLEKYA